MAGVRGSGAEKTAIPTIYQKRAVYHRLGGGLYGSERAKGRSDDAMTEVQWMACTDSTLMLELFRGTRLHPKLRRFAVECCRRIRHLLVEEEFRDAARAGEAFADDPHNRRSTIKAMAAAAIHGWRRRRRFAITADPHDLHAADAALATCSSTDWNAAFTAMRQAAQALNASDPDRCDPAELRHQAALLRCIFGPPPFRPVPLAPAICRWNGGIVVGLAQAIYEEQAFSQLPILADALEEAGCDDAGVLGHLRSSGPHARGCHALDTVLGKE
jgi:hypothetical protein